MFKSYTNSIFLNKAELHYLENPADVLEIVKWHQYLGTLLMAWRTIKTHQITPTKPTNQ